MREIPMSEMSRIWYTSNEKSFSLNDHSEEYEKNGDGESELRRVLESGTPSSIGDDYEKDTVLDLPQTSQNFNFKPAPILTSLRKFKPMQSMKFEKSGYEILSRHWNGRSRSKSKSQVRNKLKSTK
jgi:hypothetical protein